MNYVSPNTYTHILECSSFADAIKTLDEAFVKVRNIIFARHELAPRKQGENENMDQFLHELNNLASYCNFQSVSATEYQDKYTRDAFINGLRNSYIRQRLLEHPNLDLKVAFETARSLELAEEQSNAYFSSHSKFTSTVAISGSVLNSEISASSASMRTSDEYSSNASKISRPKPAMRNQMQKCGGARHNRRFCPARNDTCHKCNSSGHWAKVCALECDLYLRNRRRLRLLVPYNIYVVQLVLPLLVFHLP